jgi:aspartate carbamoyltransferase catalytic subunit
MEFYDFEWRLNRSLNTKLAELQRNERLRHVIFSAQFNRELLDYLGSVADMIRQFSKSRKGRRFLGGLLRHQRAMLYFTQPSTRTFLSFTAACQMLGIACNEVRDPSVSSEAKGESPFDSIRMFSSYFDIIIMRSVVPNFAECCGYLMNEMDEQDHRSVPIVNAGSGADEHPTQALLDIYTIKRTFQFKHAKDSSRWNRFDDELRRKYPGLTKDLDGKLYGFCGDIGRGRTVRSLASLLSLFKDVSMCFISPPHPKMRLSPDLRDRLLKRRVKIYELESFEDPIDGKPAIEAVDCLYMTRIQREHDTTEDKEGYRTIDLSKYCLSRALVARMKDYAPILHPFPRDSRIGEIPTDIDTDPRAMYFHQVRNGMWVRAALLAYLFDVDQRIASRFRKDFEEFHDYNIGVL